MLNKIKSVIIGHAIGDALGVPVEFNNRSSLKNNPVVSMRGFGTYAVPAGSWSDDTSMSLCALKSLSNGYVDYDDIMSNFVKWYTNADFTATDEVFDIGRTCYEAIYNYKNRKLPINLCGQNDERSNGNGSLMRINPFVLYAYYNNIADEKEFNRMIATASSLTHAHKCSIDGCIIYSYVLKEILKNPSKESVYRGLDNAKHHLVSNVDYYNRLLNNDIAKFNEQDIKSNGYVVSTLEAALWCLLTTKNYKDCVLTAVNLGSDTDTVAAIAGGLAGALYGMEDIPSEWLATLKRRDYIEKMCVNAYKNWEE